MPRAAQIACLGFAVLAAPWVGVGVTEWWLGKSVGMGLQLALVLAWAALLGALLRPDGWRRLRAIPNGRWLALALLWTIASSAQTWRLDHSGLAGEVPWLKSLKQVLVLCVFAGCLVAPLLVRPIACEWAGLERSLALGLLLASAYGLLQALHFYGSLPAMAALDRWASSNPSIASGSHELYLGHRFVGIPRLRGGACEPLYFGSYLLAAVPCIAVASARQTGFARRWRQLAVGLGTICLLLTFSRGVYIAALCLLAWWGLGLRRGQPRPRLSRVETGFALGATALGLLLLAALTGIAPWRLPWLLIERLQQSFAAHDMSNLTRLYAWRAALAAWGEAPLNGVGWGGYGFHYYRLAVEGGAGAHFGWPMANNLPLLVLAETGLIGLALWSAALWPCLRAAFRKSAEPRSYLLASLCLVTLVQFLTHSQLQLPHCWLLFGLALAAQRPGPAVV